jgi:hypothetical protein
MPLAKLLRSAIRAPPRTFYSFGKARRADIALHGVPADAKRARNGTLSQPLSQEHLLASFSGVYHRASIKAVSEQYSPYLRQSPRLKPGGIILIIKREPLSAFCCEFIGESYCFRQRLQTTHADGRASNRNGNRILDFTRTGCSFALQESVSAGSVYARTSQVMFYRNISLGNDTHACVYTAEEGEFNPA